MRRKCGDGRRKTFLASVFADEEVGGAGVGEGLARDGKGAHFGIAPSGGIVYGRLLYHGLNAAIEIAVTHAKQAFTVVMLEDKGEKSLCARSQSRSVLNIGRELRGRHRYRAHIYAREASPIAFAQ